MSLFVHPFVHAAKDYLISVGTAMDNGTTWFSANLGGFLMKRKKAEPNGPAFFID